MPAEKLETVKDIALGIGATSSPAWLGHMEPVIGAIMLYGGVALLLKRLGLWCLLKRFWKHLTGPPNAP